MSGLGPLLRRGAAFAWQRKWLFAVPIATLLAPAALYVVHLPDTYRATAVVSVRQMSAEPAATGLPRAQEWRAEQILSTARDRVLQADNVSAMIPVLWPKGNPQDPYTIERARSRVRYDASGDTRFSVAIDDTSPARAAEAVNVLVEAFLANERLAKLRIAEGNRDFLEAEAKNAVAAYDVVLEQISEFREAHAETMPDQRDAVTGSIQRLETEAREREAQAQRNRLLVPEVDKMLRSSLPAGGVEAARTAISADEQLAQLKIASSQAALDQAKKALAELRLRYTDKMDSVRAAALQVTTLEEDVVRAKDALDAARKRGEVDASARRRTDNEGLMSYLRQWRESLMAEEAQARSAAEGLRTRAESLSKRLADMPATNDAYGRLVDRRDDAEKTKGRASGAATNARVAAEFYRNGATAETIGFAIDARAVPPIEPSGPSRTRWLATAVLVGLIVGYGLHVLARRYVDEDLVTGPQDLADLVPGALVVSVPLLGDGPVRRRLRLGDALAALWVVACIGATAFALGAHRGWIEAPAWFRPWLGGRA